jgi:hypothetical protein
MRRCCKSHPTACVSLGWEGLISLLVVGFTFGWRWVGLILLISGQVDWLIRTWKVKEDQS